MSRYRWNLGQVEIKKRCIIFDVFKLQTKNRIKSFDDMNSKQSYQKNLRIQAHNWVYRNKDISYRFNSYGFRGEEFSTVEWDKSVIVIGDSTVFACGLAEEDTIPNRNVAKKIAKKLNKCNI